MNRGDVTEVKDLTIGDRFYLLADKTKSVKILRGLQSKKAQVRPVNDRKNVRSQLMEIKDHTTVVFLRSSPTKSNLEI